jgi:hypothetical protein
MTPEHDLLRARMTLAAHEFLLEWVTESYDFLLSISPPDVQARALRAMKDALQNSRQDQTDMRDELLPPEQSNLQASLFREAFDEAAKSIEKKLGLPE